jgi:hypothetical protein
MTEDRRQRTEDGGRKIEWGIGNAECGNQLPEGRKPISLSRIEKTENRGQKAEDR